MGISTRKKEGNSGNEEALSIEETNTLRASLGLKPLKLPDEKPRVVTEHAVLEENCKKRKRESSCLSPNGVMKPKEECIARVEAARERREGRGNSNSAVAPPAFLLGDADPEVDDIDAWVQRSRMEQKKECIQEDKTLHFTEVPRGLDGGGLDDHPTFKIRRQGLHSQKEEEEEEGIVLTLEDRPILNEQGEVCEEDDVLLENVVARENAERRKAYEAAHKTKKPLWEEDGKKRSLLDKYDEEEDEFLSLRESVVASRMSERLLPKNGVVNPQEGYYQGLQHHDATKNPLERRERELVEERKAKAKASLLKLQNHPFLNPPEEKASVSHVPFPPNDDTIPKNNVQTISEEGASIMHKKSGRMKGKKLKKKALTTEDIAMLEEEAVQDVGTRSEKQAQLEAAAQKEVEQRHERFEAALVKANKASLVLRKPSSSFDSPSGDPPSVGQNRKGSLKRYICCEEDDDDDVYAAMAKVRKLAQRRGKDGETSQEGSLLRKDVLTLRKEASAAVQAAASPMLAPGEGVLVLTDLGEATRAIARVEQHAPGVEDGVLDDDTLLTPYDHKEERVTSKTVKQVGEHPGIEEVDHAVGDRAIGSGLGGILGLLKERGDLKNAPMAWGGRASDAKKASMMGLREEVYTGGREKDRVSVNVEAALTKRDEYGRILTPKEAFRQLCYSFHGIKPSKNTKEKRQKQVEKELSQKRVASGSAQASTLEAVKAVHVAAASPYVVLRGTVQPGQSREAVLGSAMSRPKKTKRM